MSKHTPKEIWLIKQGDETVWCDIPAPSDDIDTNESVKYIRADEAAAPELLEALRDALTSMLDSGYSNDRVIIRKVRSAINKAEGKA